jgi:hypothetical protein
MKKIIYISTILMGISCSSIPKWEDLSVYTQERVGEIPPSYLILKGGALNLCDFFWYSYGTVGNYVVAKDTLYIFSQYTYYSDSVYYTDTLDINPQKFLIRKDRLIDVTDYSIDVIDNPADSIINEFYKSIPRSIYKRVR